MRDYTRLKVAAGAVGIILIGSTFVSLRNRKRDHKANQLISKLTTTLNPVSKGLSNEVALDEKYRKRIFNSVGGNIVVLKKSTAFRYAKEIHKAFRAWYQGGDLEEKVYSILRGLKDKVQVSQVSEAYQSEYGISLRDKLKERFDKDEIKIVLGIITKLPKYRKL